MMDRTQQKSAAEYQKSTADYFVKWHEENAPQPWTIGHTKSYLRSIVERDIYNKLCSIEAMLRKKQK